MKAKNSEVHIDKEAELLCACRRKSVGWEQALVIWLAGDGSWLERRCISRLGSKADAEDAVQEITLKVMRSVGQFEGRSTLRTWVTRIADNHCSSYMRQRAAKAMTAHMHYCIEIFENDRLDQLPDDADQSALVKQTLSSLTEKNRDILQMRFFGELALDEIASSLELSLSATKMRLYRAMDAFKKQHRYETL